MGLHIKGKRKKGICLLLYKKWKTYNRHVSDSPDKKRRRLQVVCSPYKTITSTPLISKKLNRSPRTYTPQRSCKKRITFFDEGNVTVDELESSMRYLDLSGCNVDTEDKKANTEILPLLSAVIDILEKAGREDILTKFLNLVTEGRFPLDNVAFSLFCDVVEWFAKEDTRQM